MTTDSLLVTDLERDDFRTALGNTADSFSAPSRA